METQTWRKGDIVGDGRFEILRELGAGGFGITYLAYDNNKRQQRAIKTLNANQQRKDDFIKIEEKLEEEAFTLRGFRHPNIVRVYEKIKIDGLLGFVMEYIPGQDLEKYVEAKGRLGEKEALHYINQISLALDYVHQDGFFHRDVNPRNIMLRQGSQDAVLIDFGLAREFVELEPIYLTNTHGSELYKPVEQYKKRGVFGPPVDIYALAVTLYYLLNGARLGHGKSNWMAYTSLTRQINYQRGMGEEADRELWAELIKFGVSPKTLAAIQAGMSIEPEQRPQNMTEFRELLGLVPVTTTQLDPLPTKDSSPSPKVSTPGEDFAVTFKPLSPPAVVRPATENPPHGLTVSMPTESIPAENPPKLPESSVQPVVKKSVPENRSPISTVSNSAKLKTTEDLPKKAKPHRQSPETQQGRSTPLPRAVISRRLILRGLAGAGGLAGFGFVGLLLKSLFQPSSRTRAISTSITSPKSDFEPSPSPSSEATKSSIPEPTAKPTVSSKNNKNIVLETIQFTTVKLDSKGKIISRPTRTAQIYKEDLGAGISITMVKIPAGSFMMGSSAKDSPSEEKPQHKVNLRAFYLGQTEVTKAQYQAIMGGNPSEVEADEFPVEDVRWLKAKEFCKKLSRKTDKTYDLPSESQWEYACRAGTNTPFTFGDIITTDVANYDGRTEYGQGTKGIYRDEPTVVTTFPPNAFGLFHMHGNVWEWCADTWHGNYQGAPTDGSAWIDENNDRSHLLRGGAYFSSSDICRSASRNTYGLVTRGPQGGFRVVYSPARRL